MSVFNFHVSMPREKRLRRRLLYTFTALLIIIVFTAGLLTVYVNSCNIINPEPMRVFGLYNDGSINGFIFLGHFYEF